MNKALKNLLFLGGTAFAGYYAYKQYQSFSNTVKMDKALHDYLQNIYGEEPQLSTVKSLSRIVIKAGFSAEVIAKYPDIETGIRDYVQEYYPMLSKNLGVEVFSKDA